MENNQPELPFDDDSWRPCTKPKCDNDITEMKCPNDKKSCVDHCGETEH